MFCIEDADGTCEVIAADTKHIRRELRKQGIPIWNYLGEDLLFAAGLPHTGTKQKDKAVMIDRLNDLFRCSVLMTACEQDFLVDRKIADWFFDGFREDPVMTG